MQILRVVTCCLWLTGPVFAQDALPTEQPEQVAPILSEADSLRLQNLDLLVGLHTAELEVLRLRFADVQRRLTEAQQQQAVLAQSLQVVGWRVQRQQDGTWAYTRQPAQ